jgi:hypothetical protein
MQSDAECCTHPSEALVMMMTLPLAAACRNVESTISGY